MQRRNKSYYIMLLNC